MGNGAEQWRVLDSIRRAGMGYWAMQSRVKWRVMQSEEQAMWARTHDSSYQPALPMLLETSCREGAEGGRAAVGRAGRGGECSLEE